MAHSLPLTKTESADKGNSERIDLPITGMSCAACAHRVEKQLGSVPGVARAGVNLASARATVEYDPKQVGIRDLMAEIKKTGYEPVGSASAGFVADDSARPSGSAHLLEEHLNRVPGVVKAGFNLATRKVQVEYLSDRVELASIRNAIKDFGYRIADAISESGADPNEQSEEYKELRRKFWVAAVLSLPILVIVMSHGQIEIFNFPGINWLQLLLATPLFFTAVRNFTGEHGQHFGIVPPI